jgi:hypothetical protein
METTFKATRYPRTKFYYRYALDLSEFEGTAKQRAKAITSFAEAAGKYYFFDDKHDKHVWSTKYDRGPIVELYIKPDKEGNPSIRAIDVELNAARAESDALAREAKLLGIDFEAIQAQQKAELEAKIKAFTAKYGLSTPVANADAKATSED